MTESETMVMIPPRRHPLRSHLAVLAVCLGSLLLAGAANARPFDDTPCREDARSICGGERPGSRVILECLQKNVKQIAPECGSHLEQLGGDKRARMERRKAAFWANCEADLAKFCEEQKSQRVAAAACLRKNGDAVSEQCRAVVPRRSVYQGPGYAAWDDGTETLEERAERAERLRPGRGRRQVMLKHELEGMTPEQREERLKEVKAEAAKRRAKAVAANQKSLAEIRAKRLAEARAAAAAQAEAQATQK